MKRFIWISLAVVVVSGLGLGGFFAYQSGLFRSVPAQAASLENAPSAVPATVIITNDSITADGRVLPVQRADLSLAVGGIVREVLVVEGEQVEAGQLLLQLDSSLQQVAVAQSQANLKRAEARLSELRSGPRLPEIAAAEATLAAAQARLDRVVQSGETGNVAAAQAAVSAAQANYARTQEGPDENSVIAAQTEVGNAEAEVRRAQRAYNEVKWRSDVGATPEAAALERATNLYNAAKARLDALYTSASQATVNAASAQIRQAQAQLSALSSALPADIAAAQADVDFSQAQLDLVLAGVRPEQIAAAEADVASAVAAVQQALVAQSNSDLRAPFAGTIASINLNPGESVTPNTPVLRLADLTRWQIETEDVGELDVTSIRPEQTVKLTFDAIPGLTVDGIVRLIRPIGKDNRGDIVYTAVIEPQQMDERLLWNMTAVVELAR